MFEIKSKKIFRESKKVCPTFEKRRGFALLFAVLTASLLLAIGMSIFRISFKELTISIAARDSQIAFYAADSARECAVYWDIKTGAFPACLNDTCSSHTNDGPSQITCGFSTIPITVDSYNNPMIYKFDNFVTYDSDSNLHPENSVEPIADITITKTYDSGNNIRTNISALGHNVGIVGRRLERGIFQTY